MKGSHDPKGTGRFSQWCHADLLRVYAPHPRSSDESHLDVGYFCRCLPLARASLSAVVCPHFTHHLNVSDGDAGNNRLWRQRRNRHISGEPNYCCVADASSMNRIINSIAELKSDTSEGWGWRMMLHIILQQTTTTWCLGSHRNAPTVMFVQSFHK